MLLTLTLLIIIYFLAGFFICKIMKLIGQIENIALDGDKNSNTKIGELTQTKANRIFLVCFWPYFAILYLILG